MTKELRQRCFLNCWAGTEDRKRYRLVFLILLLASLVHLANAQNTPNRVSGVVKAVTGGQPLSGVTVTVKGGRTATSTDNNGAFAINLPSGGTLVFTYVGFTDKE